MREYDAVLLPISFASTERHMTQFNIATRMSDCLASGTVTLAVGPEYAAMIQYLKSTEAAVIVTDPTKETLSEAVIKIRNQESRRPLLEAARVAIRTELSTLNVHSRWQASLARLSGKSFA